MQENRFISTRHAFKLTGLFFVIQQCKRSMNHFSCVTRSCLTDNGLHLSRSIWHRRTANCMTDEAEALTVIIVHDELRRVLTDLMPNFNLIARKPHKPRWYTIRQSCFHCAAGLLKNLNEILFLIHRNAHSYTFLTDVINIVASLND